MSVITYIIKGIFDRGGITDPPNLQDAPLTFDDPLQDGEHTHIIHKTLKERVEDLEERVIDLEEEVRESHKQKS